MFNTEYILNYLYNNHIILYQKGNNNKYYYRINPYKKKDLLNINDPQIKEYVEQFGTLNNSEFTYCLVNNLQEPPKCPYCNNKRKFSGNRYMQTCGSKECHQKEIERSNREKYGVANVSNIPEVIEKIKKTNMERYGYTAAASSPLIKEKTKKKFEEKYGKGITCPEYVPGSREKRNKTWIQNRDQNVSKIKDSFYKKYGVYNPSQVKEFQDKKQSKYRYENNIFDSSLELIFYIYCRENNYDIIRSPKRFSYRDFNNKLHYYYPDFKVNNNIIEIKGGFLLDENNQLTHCLLDEYSCNEEELKIKDKLAKAKQQCMEENNVILLCEDDLKTPREYINVKYGGIKYLNQFKIKK